jgi:hypothetical protein
MKITMYKRGMSRPAQPEDVERFLSAGWSQQPPAVKQEEKADDEIIRLKPPVKTKATAKTLEEATIIKGDE